MKDEEKINCQYYRLTTMNVLAQLFSVLIKINIHRFVITRKWTLFASPLKILNVRVKSMHVNPGSLINRYKEQRGFSKNRKIALPSILGFRSG